MAKVVTAPAAHLLNRNGPLDEATAAQTSRVTKAPKRGEKSRKEPKKVAAVKKGKDSGMVNVLVPAYEGRFSPGTEPSPPPSESQQSTASSLADSLDDAGVALDRSSIFSDFIEASGSLSSEDTGLLMEALNSIAESVPGTSWTESDGLFSKDFALQNPTPQATTPGLSPTRNLIRLPAESPHIHLPPQLAYSSVNPFKTGKLQKAPPKLKTARSHTGPLTPPIDPAQMKMFHGAAPSLAPPMPVPPMRKLQVKRNSIGDPANAMDVSISLPKEPGVSMRPKVYVHKACINCKVSHVACDVGRPCSRCVRLGKADTCVDAERKKRGRPCNSVKKAMLEAQAAKEAEALAASGGIVPEKPSVPPNPAGWVLAHPSDTAALPAEPPTKKQKTKNPRALEILAGPPRITPEPLSSDQTMSLSSDIPMNESTPSLNSSVEPESTDLKANPMDLVEGSNPLLTIQALQSLGVSISLAEVSQEMVRQLIESGELHTPEDILQAITAISTLLPEDSVGTASGIGFTYDHENTHQNVDLSNVALSIQEVLFNDPTMAAAAAASGSGGATAEAAAAAVEEAVAAVAQAAAAIKDAMMDGLPNDLNSMADALVEVMAANNGSDAMTWDENPSEFDSLGSMSPAMVGFNDGAVTSAMATGMDGHADAETVKALEELCGSGGEGDLRDALRELHEHINMVDDGLLGSVDVGLESPLVSDDLLRQLADSGLSLN